MPPLSNRYSTSSGPNRNTPRKSSDLQRSGCACAYLPNCDKKSLREGRHLRKGECRPPRTTEDEPPAINAEVLAQALDVRDEFRGVVFDEGSLQVVRSVWNGFASASLIEDDNAIKSGVEKSSAARRAAAAWTTMKKHSGYPVAVSRNIIKYPVTVADIQQAAVVRLDLGVQRARKFGRCRNLISSVRSGRRHVAQIWLARGAHVRVISNAARNAKSSFFKRGEFCRPCARCCLRFALLRSDKGSRTPVLREEVTRNPFSGSQQ